MVITKIEQGESLWVYEVTLTPNAIEAFFGIKERVERIKDSGREYVFGGGTVWVHSEGYKLGKYSKIGRALDKHMNKF